MRVNYINSLQPLITASYLIKENRIEEANKVLDSFYPEDDISKLCAQALRYRTKEVIPMYLRKPEAEDKQINVFDLVLKSVPPVQMLSSNAVHLMKSLYCMGESSFTHLNIGIGKGHFEVKMLEELANSNPENWPQVIKIIGVDIDEESLAEAGRNIERAIQTLFPSSIHFEYTPICAFAEEIKQSTWESIKNHGTDILGIVSAFTLHHIPTIEKRNQVLNKISACEPLLFVLVEPDANHFTSDLVERLVNCWNLFGTIFKLIDRNEVQEQEAKAIKYTFFGREIKDILGNEEDKRSEKHEPANAWANRLKNAGFNLHKLVQLSSKDNTLKSASPLNLYYHDEAKFTTTKYEGVPMVAIFTASKQL